MWLVNVELSANHPDRGNLIRRKPLGEHLDLQATFSVVIIAHRQGRLGQTHRSDGMGFLVQSGLGHSNAGDFPKQKPLEHAAVVFPTWGDSPTGVVKSRLGHSNWWGIPCTHPV
jgi:hypothetical protein